MNALEMTLKAEAALRSREAIALTKLQLLSIARQDKLQQSHPHEKPLFKKFNEIRNGIAQQENVPAYIIFSDATLLELVIYLSLTTTDLLKISGSSEVKTEKYGSAFLDVVHEYCIREKLPTRIHLKTPKRQRKATTTAGKLTDTRQMSYEMFREGMTVDAIAAERNLAIGTVKTHLSFFIASGDLRLEELVPAEKQNLINAAIAQQGNTSLRLLKDNLPEEISFGEIRRVIAGGNLAVGSR